MKISGFETQTKKEKKLDISSWISNDEKRNNLSNIDTCNNYSAACDGYRAVIIGDIDNFFYQSWNELDHPVLSLVSKACPKLNDLKHYNKITINVDEMYQISKLFAKNQIVKTKTQSTDKKGKVKTITNTVNRPTIFSCIKNSHHLNLYFANSEMNAQLDIINEINIDNVKLGINAKFLEDAMKLLKNRKHHNVTLYINDNNLYPIVIYTNDIYIMLLPVRFYDNEQEGES